MLPHTTLSTGSLSALPLKVPSIVILYDSYCGMVALMPPLSVEPLYSFGCEYDLELLGLLHCFGQLVLCLQMVHVV